MIRLLSFLAAALFLFASCKSDSRPDPEPVIQGGEYFPIKTGDYFIYHIIDTVQIGPGVAPAVSSYQIRERVDSMFTDLAGEPYFRLFRSKRMSPTGTWVDDSVIVIKKTSRRLERQENNMRQIKMIYPVREGGNWDANQLNAADEEIWRYGQVAKPYTLTTLTHDTTYQNTILVIKSDEINNVNLDQRSERYARNVGMIELKERLIRYNDADSLAGQFIIVQSRSRSQRLIERGGQ